MVLFFYMVHVNPLLTKLVPSRRLDIGLVHVLRVYGPRLQAKKLLAQYPDIFMLGLC